MKTCATQSTRHLAACLMFFLALTAAEAVGEVRTWTSTSGRTIRASLEDLSPDGSTLVLLNENGEKFRIRKDKLCAADQEYACVAHIRKTAGPHVIHEGESITFSVDRNGVLYIQGTGTKITWPNGRPAKAQRSRHTGALMPVAHDPKKPPVVVKEQVSWTNTSPAEFIAMLTKAIARSELAVSGRGLVKRYRVCGGVELNGARLGGVSIWFHTDPALPELPRAKQEMRWKQGNVAFATVTVNTHDGSESSDLNELSESLTLVQQKALLEALRSIPYDKLAGQ